MALREATVAEIADILKPAKDNGAPLCLLIGAGVSKSAGVGLAGDFVRRISEKYGNIYQRVCRECDGDKKPSYAQCMAALTPALQVALIRDDVEQSKINWAHIGIARLERSGILDTILTTNFDPLASRACALFHRFPAIYDLAGLRDEQSNQISFDKSYVKGSAIFHLHGQHTGFLLLNTHEKLQAQAKRIEPVLNAVMKGKPVIIAGYSGENDPLIDKIVALAPFNQGLFWVCHDDNDPAPNVCDKLLSLENCQIVRNMPSDRFFTDLANALNLEAPGFLASPFDHMTSILETIRPYSDLGDQAGSNLLEAAKKMLADAAKKKSKAQPNSSEIARLMAMGQYEEVWAKFGNLDANLSEDDRDNIAWAATMAGTALAEDAETKVGNQAAQLFREAGEKYAAALEIKPDMYEALNNWGNALNREARTQTGEKAAELFHKSREKYAAALQIKPDMREALRNWGLAFVSEAKTKSGDEALALYQKAAEKLTTALEINPTDYEVMDSLGYVIGLQGSLSKGDTRAQLFIRAKEKLIMAENIEAGIALYNLACVSSLEGDVDTAADFLRRSSEKKTYFPGCAHIAMDSDFDGIRDTETFKKVLQEIGCT